MKKFKNLISVVLVVSLLLVFTVPYSASSLSDSVSNDSKIDSKLKSVMESTTDDELIEVALWLSDVDNGEREDQIATKIRRAENSGDLTSTFMTETDLSTIGTVVMSNTEISEQAQTLVELKRDVENDLHSENNTDVLNAIDSTYNIDTAPLFVSGYAPLVLMKMTEEEIYNVVNSESVERIYYHEELEITDESLMFEDEIAVANEMESTNQYPYGVWQDITNISYLKDEYDLTGEGIKIGLLENCVPDFDYEGIDPTYSEKLHQQFDYHLDNNLLHCADNVYFSDKGTNHANNSLSVLSGSAENYEGIAPQSEIYCDGFNLDGGQYFFATENLLENGVNIISASIHWGGNNYDYVSKYVDYVVSNSEIIFCISAGNSYIVDASGTGMLSASSAYNAITVGNIDDNNSLDDSDYVKCSKSLYHGLPNTLYKPDVCAPGARVSTFVVDRTQTGLGGTSSACPVVSGICALLMESIPILKTSPMLLKSLLMASARELPCMSDVYSTVTSTEPSIAREYGAGMIDAYAAYMTYNSRSYRNYGIAFPDTYTFSIDVSQNDVFSEKDIYISLNWMEWNSTNGDDWGSEDNYNVLEGFHHTLSLYNPEGQLVAISDYHYDHKQFIRFSPSQSGQYTIRTTRSYTNSPAYYPVFAIAYFIK